MSYADKQLTCQDCGTSFTSSSDDHSSTTPRGLR